MKLVILALLVCSAPTAICQPAHSGDDLQLASEVVIHPPSVIPQPVGLSFARNDGVQRRPGQVTGGNIKPIPTQWPNFRLEQIPTQWPGYGLNEVSAHRR
jgi:hypothetical protein